jgi:hypothetical protein
MFDVDKTIHESVQKLLATQPFFSDSDLLNLVAEAAWAHDPTIDFLSAFWNYLHDDPDLVALGEVCDERQFTTREVYALERTRIARTLRKMHSERTIIAPFKKKRAAPATATDKPQAHAAAADEHRSA